MKIKLFEFINDNYDGFDLDSMENEVNEFCEGKHVIDIRTTYHQETDNECSSYTITILYEDEPEDMLRSER